MLTYKRQVILINYQHLQHVLKFQTNKILVNFSLSVHYARISGHRVDIASMCAEPQDEWKLSSFHVPKHVLIAAGIDANFVTVLTVWNL